VEPNYNSQHQHYPPAPARTNSKAIVALVLGILSLVIPYLGIIVGIIAIVFAKLAFNELRSGGEQGKGLAVAGLVCGIIGVAIYAIFILIAIIAFLTFANVYSPFF